MTVRESYSRAVEQGTLTLIFLSVGSGAAVMDSSGYVSFCRLICAMNAMVDIFVTKEYTTCGFRSVIEVLFIF